MRIIARRPRPLGTVAGLILLAATANAQEGRTVTGMATYRERIALPPDSVFEATLEDVSRADAPADVIGRARIERPGQPPFRFSIQYDPARIVEGRSYSVRARVTVSGKLMFSTDQSYPVLTRGKGSEVPMMIMRRASTSSPSGAPVAAAPLQETYWKLTRLEDKPVIPAEKQGEPNLVFRSEQGRVTGSGGCNNLTGTYKLNGGEMTLSGIAATRRACLQGMEIEGAFFKALDKVRTWKILGQNLELYDAGGNLLARFEARALK